MSNASDTRSIGDLIRDAGLSALMRKLEALDCKVRGMRCQCPWEGCQDKGPGRGINASISDSGKGKFSIHCFGECGQTGDLLDLIMRVDRIDKAAAIAQLRGQQAAAPARKLAIVPKVPLVDDSKLSPADALRYWNSLARSDPTGEAYLDGRRMTAAHDRGLVRYALETNTAHKEIAARAKGGWRVAMLCSDVLGNARGMQFRLVRPQRNESEPKVLSLTKSNTGTAFFGEPWLIAEAPIVHVCEGMFDTLTVQTWAPPGSCVVGGAGIGSLPKIASELQDNGIGIEGKIFCLYVQNDPKKNISRKNFADLRSKLRALGASCVWIDTPRRYDDVGDWIKGEPLTAWPPAELGNALRQELSATPEAQSLSGPVDPLEVPESLAVTTETSDLATLLYLLGDDDMRAATIGRGDLWRNEMTGRVMFGDAPQSFPEAAVWMRRGLQARRNTATGNGFLKFSKTDVEDAVRAIASRNTRHPVREYLKRLPPWDGVDRTDALVNALEAKASPLADVLLRKWLISCVARVMEPGCQVDTVLILSGPQGAKKSSFFSTLAGGGWHSPSMGDLRNKDSLMVLAKFWMLEWPELEAMLKATPEAVKSFITARIDSYRPPYGHDVIDVPRPSVLVGTTNEDRFLEDPTGARRFWVISVGEWLDLDWVRASRDMLWAQAMAGYAAPGDHRWHLTKDESKTLSASSLERHDTASDDAWYSPIQDWLERQGPTCRPTVAHILVEACDVNLGMADKKSVKRVKAIMKSLGWDGPKPMWVGGKTTRAYEKNGCQQ